MLVLTYCHDLVKHSGYLCPTVCTRGRLAVLWGLIFETPVVSSGLLSVLFSGIICRSDRVSADSSGS